MDLREEKALVGFSPTGHSGIHIQPELVNPIYAAGNPRITSNPKPSGWGASPHRYEMKNSLIVILGILHSVVLVDVWVMGLPIISYSFLNENLLAIPHAIGLMLLASVLFTKNRIIRIVLFVAGFLVLSGVPVIAGIQRDCLSLTLVTAMPFYLLGLGILIYEASVCTFTPKNEES